MPALLPLLPWIIGGSLVGGVSVAVGSSVKQTGEGVDKFGDGLLKGAIAGVIIYYVYKQVS